jgi:predicted amidohydrolase YtcJ
MHLTKKKKGSFRKGYLGDLVVLAEDPQKVRSGTIKDVQVPVVGGKIVFRTELQH